MSFERYGNLSPIYGYGDEMERVFLAGLGQSDRIRMAKNLGVKDWLISLGSLSENNAGKVVDKVIEVKKDSDNFFLDNGAYTLQAKMAEGKAINYDVVKMSENLADFMKKNERYKEIDWIPPIDPPGQVGKRECQKSLEILEDAGINPTPVWHLNYGWEMLENLCKDHNKICIGGVASQGSSKEQLEAFHAPLKYCKQEGVKTHLFGMTDSKYMWKYRDLAYSVDSTTHTTGSRNGQIYLTGEQYPYFFKQVQAGYLRNKGSQKEWSYKELDRFNMRSWMQIREYYCQFGEWK